MFEKIDEIGINPNTDFYDKGHLNDTGTIKVSNYLGKYIVEQYNLTDMRKIKNNIWQKNLQNKYLNCKKTMLLNLSKIVFL